MTLLELLTLASDSYGDGASIMGCFDPVTGKVRDTKGGDTLALFMARELAETYTEQADDRVQLEDAMRVLEIARDDLQGVIFALQRAWDELPEEDDDSEKGEQGNATC